MVDRDAASTNRRFHVATYVSGSLLIAILCTLNTPTTISKGCTRLANLLLSSQNRCQAHDTLLVLTHGIASTTNWSVSGDLLDNFFIARKATISNGPSHNMRTKNTSVALLTYRVSPDPTADDALLLAALSETGMQTEAVPWDADDALERLARHDLAIIRSTWNYTEVFEQFNDWLSAVAAAEIRLCNSPATVRWNADKIYLRELDDQGHATVETLWLDRNQPVNLAQALEHLGTQRAVVKPRISATARGLFPTSIKTAEEDQHRLDELLATHDAMLQPFANEIVEQGEWSLMYFGARFSHAVIKRPKQGDHRVQSNFGGSHQPATPSATLIEDGQRLVDAAQEREGAPLLYARVDGVERNDRLVLMELELIEPELFLRADQEAARRLVRALRQRI